MRSSGAAAFQHRLGLRNIDRDGLRLFVTLVEAVMLGISSSEAQLLANTAWAFANYARGDTIS